MSEYDKVVVICACVILRRSAINRFAIYAWNLVRGRESADSHDIAMMGISGLLFGAMFNLFLAWSVVNKSRVCPLLHVAEMETWRLASLLS
jgi:hypothetical protein